MDKCPGESEFRDRKVEYALYCTVPSSMFEFELHLYPTQSSEPHDECII